MLLIIVGTTMGQTLKLTYPNGSEVFEAGSSTDITWEVTPESEIITIEYSIDNGSTWQIITEHASHLKYTWYNIPEPASNKCLIRIKNSLLSWQKCLGGSGISRNGAIDGGHCIQQAKDGGYILAGVTDFAAKDILNNVVGHCIEFSNNWVMKLRSDGSIEWQRCVNGCYSLCNASDGGYVAISNDLIIKLNVDGTPAWQHDFQNIEIIINWTSIIPTKDDGYCATGYSYNNTTDYESWLVKFKSDGTIDWYKQISKADDQILNSIYQTSDGGYITAGGNGDIRTTQFNLDGWIVKFNAQGIIEWQKTCGGSKNDEINSIQQTNDGKYIAVGATASDDGVIKNNYGGKDFWVVILNKDGSIESENSYGGNQDDILSSVLQSYDHKCIVAGLTRSNNGLIKSNYGYADAWIAQLNSERTFDWSHCFGGSAIDGITELRPTFDGGYVGIGSTRSNDGDVSGNHGGLENADMWVIKLKPENQLSQDISESTFSIVKSTNNAILQAMNTSAYSGEIIEVPIILNKQENLSIASVSSLRTDLAFNPTLLYPLDYPAQIIDDKTAKITIDNLPINGAINHPIAKIKFKAALGNAEECDLTLSNAITNGAEAELTLIHGIFKLLGICHEGGTRLINPNAALGIRNIATNDIKTKLIITAIVSEPDTKIKLYTLDGKLIKEIDCSVDKTNPQDFAIDITDIPGGMYIVEFQSTTFNQTEKIIIEK